LAFDKAGFNVEAVNCEFDGSRVNVNCGATDLSHLSRQVRKSKADVGLAFDGDGDRVKAVDEYGHEVSGDRIIALFATRLPRYRKQGAAVMTQMTNMGVEEELLKRGIKLIRTEVGDIQVLTAMRRHKLNLGGEQSGHIILRDKVPSGDGILVGLQLAAMVRSLQQPLSSLVANFVEFPQKLVNLRVRDRLAWRNDKKFNHEYKKLRNKYTDVRFYLRPSGTEDVVRVLTESRLPERCEAANAVLCEALLRWDKRKK
jgi:phosphoglucosamine mutase